MGGCNLVTTMVLCLLTPLMILGKENYEVAASSSQLTLAPNCTKKCGNISIPYPFGIEDGCHILDEFNSYKWVCNHSFSPPKLFFFANTNLEVVKFSLEGVLSINMYVSFDCYNLNQSSWNYSNWVFMKIFTLSSNKNMLVAIGCDTYVWFSGFRGTKPYHTGVMTQCSDLEDVVDGACNGIGCCETALPDGVSNISISVKSFSNHSLVPFNPCSSGFAVDKDVFKFYKSNVTQKQSFFENDIQLPVVFNWAVGTVNCSAARASGGYLCKENTECYDPPEHQLGYRCKCKPGFSGNPYLPQGCADIDECKESNECEKAEYCVNTIGSYNCTCPTDYHGNGTKTDHCISVVKDTKPWLIPVFATAGAGGGIIALLVIGFLLHWKHGRQQLKKMRESFFRKNGGFLLHQKLGQGDEDQLKIFTVSDLELATNNYNDINIIGRGGFGIVYKGTLPNNRLVAIKKSLKVDPNQVEQFVNEVLVLSKINNRNVVKLLGCCLEDEVPLLVYEFINNRTLYENLHEDVRASKLTWCVRLKIASQVADVLSYLHNTISPRIIHRDMKSMNILLDESYTAKVTDFGASRLVPIDQGQLATMVLGTWGYLDPEYLQTSELTEKSDVYSFGVVLVELITRKKAVCSLRPEIEKCLAMHFLVKMKEGCLMDIIDKNIVSEETIGEIQQVANLAKWCLMLKGEDRPTMKDVAIELETISKKGLNHPWNNDVERPIEEDFEALLGGNAKSRTDGCSSGVDSDLYDPFASLRGGR